MTDENSLNERPSPETLLSRIEKEERKARRGRLKIFFGSCAGVGKTYSMLTAAHEQLKQGTDILIGIVETHQRPQTQALLEGLPVLPPRLFSHHGITISELDLDKALERKPSTILIDELAHTNAPGARHPKRWQDVVELLDAGINVYTTLNVQHIESLSDIVAGTTGVWVKETVPDSIFDMAEDVVLVDIDSDDLLKRLHEGNVYVAPGANKRAADNFFKKTNLNALREIALRRTAERVDAETAEIKGTQERISIADNLLVCVDADLISAKLIRATKRLSVALKAPWTAIHIETHENTPQKAIEKRRHMEQLDNMIERLGGKLVILNGASVVDEIVHYAREHHITKMIVGKDYHAGLRGFFKGLFITQILKKTGSIDVIVIAEDRKQPRPQPLDGISPFVGLRPLDYLLAFLTVLAVTVLGRGLSIIFTPTDQALLYLAVSVPLAARLGLGPALFYALLAGAAFSVFFAPSFSFSTGQQAQAYLMTFAVMLMTGYMIATQAAKLRYQVTDARLKEKRTQTLYDITRKLTSTNGRFPVSEVVAREIMQNHNVDVTIWMTNAAGHPAVILGDLPQDTYYKDFGALQWCFENTKNAGLGTATMPSASGLYLPLTSAAGALGVLGVFPRQREQGLSHDEVASIETLAHLLAAALERVRADEIVQQSVVEKTNQKLQESLRHSLSQTVHTPLEFIKGSMSNLLKSGEPLDTQELRSIGLSIDLEAQKLSKSLDNLLNTQHLEIGTPQINLVPASLEKCIDAALEKTAKLQKRHTLRKDIDQDMPDVLIDLSMIEQVIVNILENAFTYAPPSSEISLTIKRQGPELMVFIDDQGPGFPEGAEQKVFDKFFSVPHAGQRKGAGLGLTLSAGIIRLHKGRIWAMNRPEGGARVAFTLPIA